MKDFYNFKKISLLVLKARYCRLWLCIVKALKF